LHEHYLSIKVHEKLMPNEFDIIYAFKFTPSNYGHEENRAINSWSFIDIHFLFTACCENEFASTTKTGSWHRS
jgi:hypothetical protein